MNVQLAPWPAHVLTFGILTVLTLREEKYVVALPEGHRLASRSRVRVADLRGEDLIVHPVGVAKICAGMLLEMRKLIEAAGIPLSPGMS